MNRRIGFLLKHVHTLLEDTMARALHDHDLSRRQWQALNAVSEGDDPYEALKAFDGVGDAVRELTAKGWITGTALTEEGKTAHAAVLDRVAEFRQLAIQGVSTQDFQTTLAVLNQMAANLEAA
ncbi:MarR family winged helix-turn-helix transcriptional regulator [Nonomuraea sp. NPDC050022]|uniref:MarR family winged helix-turn-helix transcriptional regulator n=1 Tax=unclassified Nonomuraea TaxID=2593643 RepID=UPI0033F5513D